MAKLREETSITARALEFLILTAARTSEALGAGWDEVDLHKHMWVVAAVRMKAGKEHRVPLSARAIAIIKEMAEIRQSEFLFPGGEQDRPLSQMALAMLLRRKGYGHVTVHGFRSAFRDWVAECTPFPREAAEMALAHAVGDKVQQAYLRADMFETRRKLMDAWATYCGRRTQSGAVVPSSCVGRYNSIARLGFLPRLGTPPICRAPAGDARRARWISSQQLAMLIFARQSAMRIFEGLSVNSNVR